MKALGHLPLSILISFFFWLGFADNITFFVVISWIYLGFGYLGLFCEYKRLTIWDLILSLPFIGFNGWMLYKHDETHWFFGAYALFHLIAWGIVTHLNNDK